MKPVRNKVRQNAQRTMSVVKDPIEVVCRLRPCTNQNDVICIRAKNDTTVVMTAANPSTSRDAYKETRYIFKHVFDEYATQKFVFDRVAFPLVEDLLKGSNGLLFTYGITSSGKTYTMTGDSNDPGILPQSLDAIFNSIKQKQTPKYRIKSEGANGFKVQSTETTFRELKQQSANSNKYRPKNGKKAMPIDWSARSPSKALVSDINSDQRFAVFVSYVQIYNNYVYDLLEESSSVRSKKIFEGAGNVYISDVKELEVKTVQEALDLYDRGQSKREISETALNVKSSRSHCVFTIRVVQAPSEAIVSDGIQDSSQFTVSHLSLVDLAGSERSKRTGNENTEVKVAGFINNSLTTLRQCIEALRKNQQRDSRNERMPYRESKLTFLFKPFFEGNGKIRMIVCVNPRADDYNENVSVMAFAEMTQEVQIVPTTVSTPIHFTPRPVQASVFMQAGDYRSRGLSNDDHEIGIVESEYLDAPVYDMEVDDFPDGLMNSCEDEDFSKLIEFLEVRQARRIRLQQERKRKQDEFRRNLIAAEEELNLLRQTAAKSDMDLRGRTQQVKKLERKISALEMAKTCLERKVERQDEELRNSKSLNCELQDKLRESDKAREKQLVRTQGRIELEKERMRRMMETRLAEKQAELERKMCFNEEKFRQLREILNNGEWELGGDFFFYPPAHPAPAATSSVETVPKDIRMTRAKTTMTGSKQQQENLNVAQQTKAVSDSSVDRACDVDVKVPKSNIAVANPRHRRSQSSSGNVWLEHKPTGCLEFGTVLQPKMKRKKSVSKLEVKDITNTEVSKYVLTHQEQDSKGEVETQLYKGDVIPSAGGGVQIIFNDVEKLTQESPPRASYNLRKRSAENVEISKIENRCSTAVEGHGLPSKIIRRAH